MKLNKLLGTAVLCSTLMLAISCSNQFKPNQSLKSGPTAQELLLQEKVGQIKNVQTTLISAIKGLNASNKDLKDNLSADQKAIVDNLEALNSSNDLTIEEMKNQNDVLAQILEALTKKKVSSTSAATSSDAPKNIVINSDGNTLEVDSGEDFSSLVYTHTSIVDGDEIVLSAEKDMGELMDDNITSDLLISFTNKDGERIEGRKLENKKVSIVCVNKTIVDGENCTIIAVSIISNNKYSQPMMFKSFEGEYKQYTSKDNSSLETTSPVSAPGPAEIAGDQATGSTYDEVGIGEQVTNPGTEGFSEQEINDKIDELGLSYEAASGVDEEGARAAAIESLKEDKNKKLISEISEDEINDKIEDLGLYHDLVDMDEAKARKIAIDALLDEKQTSN